ncbi:GGDEF domain-containing protein [Pseudomaricurvus sp.]|uniref:GGDEF domain-containing protein n=1 Tax=Pseudomaricurvus sp. TaxID=2004510 RepID=UPI003F6BC3B7
MLRSLTVKLTLAMLTTSLLTLTVVAIITPRLIEQRFVSMAKKQHYQVFQQSIGAFLGTGASLGTSEQARQFSSFLRGYMDRNRQRPRHSFGPPRMGPGSPPPPRPERRTSPPFEFLVVDPVGHVLVPTKTHDVGEQVKFADFSHKDTLQVNGSTVAFVITHEDPPLNDNDKAYLDVLKTSLYTGLIIALAINLVVGFFLGTRLSSALKKLTSAVKNMGNGELRQQVNITSNDEIGVFASAFNRMNNELASAYQELKTSHQTIEKQALELKELSVRDELTGLHNRRFFNEQFTLLHANAVRYNHPFVIVLGDIDKFKSINDNFSHLIGDQVLTAVAHIIQKSVRDGDVVARYGGEEIAIIFSESDAHEAFTITERIRKSVEQYPWQTIHPDLQVTISFGLCTQLDPSDSMKMLDTADNHLYQAKEAGRNRTISEIHS